MQQLPGFAHIVHAAPVELPGLAEPAGARPLPSQSRRFGPKLAVMHPEGAKKMLWTICAVLLVLWLLGIATSYTAGGLIHVLLAIALIVMVIRLFQGRRLV